MQNFRKLHVWEKAHALALAIQSLTASIPRRGNTGLIDQLRRSALSIPANIAEGAGKSTSLEFARFLQIAYGSANEVDYHLQFAADSGLIPRADFDALRAEAIEIRKMLIGLMRRARGTS
ncbi:MAG: four helix bundle protein [Gemmatimonadaceae bacterium]